MGQPPACPPPWDWQPPARQLPGNHAHFQLRGELLRGGMGIVSEATDTGRFGQRVAIKFLPAGETSLTEIKTARRLIGTYIGSVLDGLDLGEVEGWNCFALVMEWFPVVLDAVLQRLRDSGSGAPLSFAPQTILRWCREFAEGVQQVHNYGFVHCDIRPGNLAFKIRNPPPSVPAEELEGYDHTGQVIDFGVAVRIGALCHLRRIDDDFAAPELKQEGCQADPRTDVYGLGLVFAQLARFLPDTEARFLCQLAQDCTAEDLLKRPPLPEVIARLGVDSNREVPGTDPRELPERPRRLRNRRGATAPWLTALVLLGVLLSGLVVVLSWFEKEDNILLLNLNPQNVWQGKSGELFQTNADRLSLANPPHRVLLIKEGKGEVRNLNTFKLVREEPFRNCDWGFLAPHVRQAVLGSGTKIRLVDIDRQVPSFDFNNSDVSWSLGAFSSDGRLFAAEATPKLIVWDLHKQTKYCELYQGPRRLFNMAFCRKDSRLLTRDDKTVRVWDIDLAKESQHLDREGAYHVRNFDRLFSLDRSLFLLTGSDIEVVDLKSLEITAKFHYQGSGVQFSSDNKRVLCNSATEATLWDVDRKAQVCKLSLSTALTPDTGNINSVVLSPNGKRVLTGHRTGDVLLWDVATEKPTRVAQFKAPLWSVTFLDDNRALLWCADGAVYIWGLPQ
jgi:serine/threonine protein kinase